MARYIAYNKGQLHEFFTAGLTHCRVDWTQQLSQPLLDLTCHRQHQFSEYDNYKIIKYAMKQFILCTFFFLSLSFVTPCGAYATDHSSPSIKLYHGWCLYILTAVFEACCFHFLFQISFLCFLWSPSSLCPLDAHFNACLAMRSSPHLNVCPNQFNFLLHILYLYTYLMHLS